MSRSSDVSDIVAIQLARHVWAQRNFGDNDNLVNSVLGVSEEAGELAHALLKQRQGIRGTSTELDDEMMDAVGDIVMYLMGVCSHKGWDFELIVQSTWSQIKRRDWRANPLDGS